MSMMRGYRWSVEVQGGAQLKGLLNSHLPALVTELDDQGQLFIAHPDIETAQTYQDVREAAGRVLAAILPALSVATTYVPPAGLGGTVREHGPDGAVARRHHFLTVQDAISVSVALSLGAVVGGVPVPPPRTQAERATALSAVSSDFRDASLRLHEAGDDVRKLYVVYEYVRDTICGGARNWRRLVSKGWATEADLERFRDTANNLHRHKPSPMPNAMSPAEARELIRRLLGRWVDDQMPR